ncbi:hypothetical protein FOL47_005647 [Perkinsus chesapeaki]|uniref:Uncharacterized protein n=1 Tax=Perkinsus chesapeaki TaxID=330153 RepID=A0A7J6LWK8_PERCH|nr:hypothetical protein FOL47_005647 [Perkinsus chesapeaki]
MEPFDFVPLWRIRTTSSLNMMGRIEKARVDSYKQDRILVSIEEEVKKLRKTVNILEELAATSVDVLREGIAESVESVSVRYSQAEAHLMSEPLSWIGGGRLDRELLLVAEKIQDLNRRLGKIESILSEHLH